MISAVEFRSEDDADVAPYCHSKAVQVSDANWGMGRTWRGRGVGAVEGPAIILYH